MRGAKRIRLQRRGKLVNTTRHEEFLSSATFKQSRLPEEIILLIVQFSVEELNEIKLGKSPVRGVRRMFRNPFLRVDRACRTQVLQSMRRKNLWIMLRGDSKKLREDLLDDLREELPVFPDSLPYSALSYMPIVCFKLDDGNTKAYRTRNHDEKQYSILFPFNMKSYLSLISSLANGVRASRLTIHIPSMSHQMQSLVQTQMIPALFNTVYRFDTAHGNICLDGSEIILSAEAGCNIGTQYVAEQIHLAALNIKSLGEKGLHEESMLYSLYIGARMVDIIEWNLQPFTCVVYWATRCLSRTDWSSYTGNSLRMKVLLTLHKTTMLAAKWIDLHADDLEPCEFHRTARWQNLEILFRSSWTLGWFGLSHVQRAQQYCALSSFRLFNAEQIGDIPSSWLTWVASPLAIATEMLGEDDRNIKRVRARLDKLMQRSKMSITAESFLKSKMPQACRREYTTVDGEPGIWIGDDDQVDQMRSAVGDAFPYLERAEKITQLVVKSGEIINFGD